MPKKHGQLKQHSTTRPKGAPQPERRLDAMGGRDELPLIRLFWPVNRDTRCDAERRMSGSSSLPPARRGEPIPGSANVPYQKIYLRWSALICGWIYSFCLRVHSRLKRSN
jgi:hypothetical protein